MDAIFSELGIDEIVSGGQTMNPATEELREAVERVKAKTVFILPNNKNIIMTAGQVAELTDRNVVVIPTRSVPQGFSAMLGFDPDATVEENERTMTECAHGVDTMQITYAARNSNFDDMDIAEGDFLALFNDKLLCSSKEMNILFDELAEKIKENQKSFVSIYYGEGISEQEAEKAVEYFREKLGNDIEINLYSGEQSVYFYVISAE